MSVSRLGRATFRRLWAPWPHIEKTETDAGLEAVRRLFEVPRRFGEKDAKGFQIIVTEHANLRDDWFQFALSRAALDQAACARSGRLAG